MGDINRAKEKPHNQKDTISTEPIDLQDQKPKGSRVKRYTI